LLTITFFVFFTSCGINSDTPIPSSNVGDTLWIHEKPVVENTTWIRDMPMAIGKDGSIYYLVSGEKVFAIQGDNPLGQSAWYCAIHDNRNTYNYLKH